MVAVTLAASSAFASPRATSTTSSTVRPSPLTTTVRMATACHPPAPGAAAGLGKPRPRDVTRWLAASSGQYENYDNRHRRGTGTLGRRVAAELEARGNQVRPLSRHAPEYRVDLATGE